MLTSGKARVRRLALSFSLALMLWAWAWSPAFAHQPFFESPDSTASVPVSVADPAISTALFGTLERPGDVDFYTFRVSAGQRVEVGMTVPQIEGQERFAPTVGVIAAGLDPVQPEDLPGEAGSLLGGGKGALVLGPTGATVFFEPFSRTAYWRRQRTLVSFPGEGEVHVVVWHEQDAVGRYTLVIGQREVPGGEADFRRKLRAYWTPVQLEPPAGEGGAAVGEGDSDAQANGAMPESRSAAEEGAACSWLLRLLAALLGWDAPC